MSVSVSFHLMYVPIILIRFFVAVWRLGFEDWIWVLIASVPGFCILLPPFGKELLTRLTTCSLCILTICIYYLFIIISHFGLRAGFGF